MYLYIETSFIWPSPCERGNAGVIRTLEKTERPAENHPGKLSSMPAGTSSSRKTPRKTSPALFLGLSPSILLRSRSDFNDR